MASDGDIKKMMGATIAGTMIGISTMFALQGMQKDPKTKQRELKLQRLKEKKNKYMQNKMIQEFLNDKEEI